MKQFVLDFLENECVRGAHISRCLRETHEADLLVELTSGKRVAIYVINRALRLPEIRERYEQNTRRKIHTLFLVDGRMLPQQQMDTTPPPWMNALHMLTQGRVYAYACDRRAVEIRPVHIEWRWGSSSRRIELGKPVNVAELRPSSVTTGAHQMDGTFATADFGEGAFWKKRDPNEGRQFDFSWRNWSFGGTGKAQQQEETPDWDPWDEFQRQYGDAGDFMGADRDRGFNFDFDNYGQTGQARAKTRGRRSAQPHHYTTLGLSMSSSITLDEVKSAYRRKARENHPDLHPTEKDKYTERMALINAAFEAISRDLE